MFVVSLSKNKIKKVFFTALAVGVLSLCLVLLIAFIGQYQSMQTSAGISLLATNEQERLAFISHYGWEVDKDAVEIQEIVIPEVFDDVYENYNEIQLEQGFNLTKYAGQRVKRWTYIVRNYPDTSPEEDYIRLNLLVSDGVIIGGDVCSVKLDGFMHGFDKE